MANLGSVKKRQCHEISPREIAWWKDVTPFPGSPLSICNTGWNIRECTSAKVAPTTPCTLVPWQINHEIQGCVQINALADNFLPQLFSSARICFLPPEFSNLHPTFSLQGWCKKGSALTLAAPGLIRVSKAFVSSWHFHLFHHMHYIHWFSLPFISCCCFALPSSLPGKIVCWSSIERQTGNKCWMSPIKLHLNWFLSTKCDQNRTEYCCQ